MEGEGGGLVEEEAGGGVLEREEGGRGKLELNG